MTEKQGRKEWKKGDRKEEGNRGRDKGRGGKRGEWNEEKKGDKLCVLKEGKKKKKGRWLRTVKETEVTSDENALQCTGKLLYCN